MSRYDRREFLFNLARGAGACTLGSVLGFPTLPRAVTMFQRPAPPPANSILVLINLQGGYDALSMLPPTAANSHGCWSPYQTMRARVDFGVSSPVPLSLNGVTDYGIHPELTVVRNWFNQGKCAIVLKTGLPTPILSHFSSQDLMSLGRNDFNNPDKRGWLGRLADTHFSAGVQTANALRIVGVAVPNRLDFNSTTTHPLVVNNLGDFVVPAFQSQPENAYRRDIVQQVVQQVFPSDPVIASTLRGTINRSFDLSTLLAPAIGAPLTGSYFHPSFTDEPLGFALQDIARMIGLSVGTRVFYAMTGGFDTHGGQEDRTSSIGDKPTLSDRLKAVNAALNGFITDLQATSKWNQTTIVLFTEFGRRNQDNATLGCDHGYGFHTFLLGGAVLGGIRGNPLLASDIQAENLPVNVDSRTVYKKCIEEWLGLSGTPIFDDFVPSPNEPVLGPFF